MTFSFLPRPVFAAALICLIAAGSTALGAARDGGSDGGGGNGAGLSFAAAAREALDDWEQSPTPSLRPEIGRALRARLAGLKVVSVSNDLLSSLEDVTQNSVALNFPALGLVKVNEERWRSLEDPRLRRAIALHELLSLEGRESTGAYPMSAEYLSARGFTGNLAEALAPKPLRYVPPAEPVQFFHFETESLQQVFDPARGRMVDDAHETDFRTGGLLIVWTDGPKTYRTYFPDPKRPRMDAVTELEVQRPGANPNEILGERLRVGYGEPIPGLVKRQRFSIVQKVTEVGLNQYSVDDLSPGVLAGAAPSPMRYTVTDLGHGGSLQFGVFQGRHLVPSTGHEILGATHSFRQIPATAAQRDAYRRTPLQGWIDAFTKVHRSAVGARQVLIDCLARGPAPDCRAEQADYRALDEARDREFSELTRIEEKRIPRSQSRYGKDS